MISVSTNAGVRSTFEYVSPESKHNLRFSGDGAEINTGVFNRHTVFIRNARPEAANLNLSTCGFQLVPHASATDFYDDETVEARCAAEIESVLKEITGADKAVLFGGLRRNVARPQGRIFHAASDVHVDYCAEEAQKLGRSLLGLAPDAEVPYRRFMAINLWRALSPPPQDRPLAVCDARSVKTQSGAYNSLIRVEKRPSREEMMRERPDTKNLPNGWIFHFDPAHRWYYYPDMTADELLLFKLYDSTETGPWRCPHASFVDPNVLANAQPRESYEIRSFVYFR